MNHYPFPDHVLKGVANCRDQRCGTDDSFEATFGATGTADIASKLRQMNVYVCVLDGIIKNKHANNPGKLAASISASPVEKAPKKKAAPTP